MTQLVLYMAQDMLIPSESERAATKSAKAKNPPREQKLVIPGGMMGNLSLFSSDGDDLTARGRFGLQGLIRLAIGRRLGDRR